MLVVPNQTILGGLRSLHLSPLKIALHSFDLIIMVNCASQPIQFTQYEEWCTNLLKIVCTLHVGKEYYHFVVSLMSLEIKKSLPYDMKVINCVLQMFQFCTVY